jgi:WXG100 family type VII secretion target
MVLKASPEQIRGAGKQLVGDAERYLNSVHQLYETVDNLQASWQGADNVKFATTVNGYKENITALGQVIGNYGVFLQETANSLEKLQAEIAQQAANL